ncbi:MAG: polyribonucleotide nucleotidyltransferase [Candidatus Pacebacteria bacterium]|nr:polyribonucleotide nucleotidyltransferase [Candidatus Paceibacterota bacterium]MDD2796783.1 polyribonucleotide nucleotidyltransferase [Candidatus Paceibacterota bacterium]MDD3048158.1 polyribonucleotide nucleotidyltransferase [Candidatus Paceibacterota bacterium]MDD3510054.1 polyribonucleotide nucleotidyltransferase [Candidatus Paceibacterota bacterium]MDD3918821.1 polyribonucleotide nucleotidyltransferase [Candidatus Paceibacterota bacterium]
MESKIFNLEVEGKPLTVTINSFAERADGSVFVQFGETTLLATCVMGENDVEGIDYFPLSVNYEEKFYAGGEIFGSRFTRREGRPSDESVLTARLVDRTLRPLFNKSIKREVNVTITLLSFDGKTDPASIAIFAGSLALLLSDIPWNGPVSGVRIGKDKQRFVIFPDYNEREEMDLLVSGLKDKDGSVLFNMFEAGFKEAFEDEVLKAVSFSKKYIEKLLNFQFEIQKQCGKAKRVLEAKRKKEEVEKEILNVFEKRFKDEVDSHNLGGEVKSYLKEKYQDSESINYGMNFLEDMLEKTLHDLVLKEGKRPDKRGFDEIRDLACYAKYLPRVHGSGVFTRGQTKTLSVLTLGGPGEEKILEGVEFKGKKRFLHHYNFPSFSVGDTRPSRGPGRREIGHGRLGEKALLPVLPDFDSFPYVIRIVSEVLCSNGSSSMASTCSACLALMDGGVPISKMVAGIAMGIVIDLDSSKLIKERKFEVLTDIQGAEDHYGDMDFKVAGTDKGITALQMDVKIDGLTEEMLQKGLLKAKMARFKILDVMRNTISKPRAELSVYAPRVFMKSINPEKIGDVIGSQGKVINKIIEECDVTIEIEDSGKIYITSKNKEGMEKACKWIDELTEEVEIGKEYFGVVKKILDFGAIVEVLPGQEGMVHISELDNKRVAKVSDVVKIGDRVKVKVISFGDNGKISLSLKQVKNDQSRFKNSN